MSSASTVQALSSAYPRSNGEGAGAAEPGPLDALSLAQLLTSRMCHDLSGAIGVTASAEDLIGTGPELEADAVSLVADAGRRAEARLVFFRAAFGFDRASRGMTSSELRALVEPALDRPRLRFAWDEAGETTSAAASPELPFVAARLVLCLCLLASEALPRGGTIRVTTGGGSARYGITIEAEGPGARVMPKILQALQAADCGDLTSATVVGYYTQVLAGRIAASVTAEVGEDRVRLSLAPLGSGGSRRH